MVFFGEHFQCALREGGTKVPHKSERGTHTFDPFSYQTKKYKQIKTAQDHDSLFVCVSMMVRSLGDMRADLSLRHFPRTEMGMTQFETLVFLRWYFE